MNKVLTKRKENYSLWYQELIIKAKLAENSTIRGCMIIKPYGFSIWEKIKLILDKKLKNTNHQNVYFPIFIPKSYLNKEAEHIKGFAKECAIITHYKLKNIKKIPKLYIDNKTKLKEELIIRPTSESIIWNSYKNWIKSYRDLPILINQWANVVRWEMRTRLFLRTTEFLWQEGHTAHSTKKESIIETKKILNIYADFIENYMSIPVLKGIKTKTEKFSGAKTTYTIESLMQDGKALQIATSHFLGQNFSKAFDVKFTNKNGKFEHVWGTSWGTTTRLIGALIMTHSDDNGLILPPLLSPIQIVIIPIYKKKIELKKIKKIVLKIKSILKLKNISILFDSRSKYKPGWKFTEYELKGVPIRITIGPKEILKKTIELTRRDTNKKIIIKIKKIEDEVVFLLNDIQKKIYNKALLFVKKKTKFVNKYEEFKKIIKNNGGFVLAHWDGTAKTEQKIKEKTKATIRCIPINKKTEKGRCIYTNKNSTKRVVFAKSY